MNAVVHIWAVVAMVFLAEMLWAYFKLGLRDYLQYAMMLEFPPEECDEGGAACIDFSALIAMTIHAALWPFYIDEVVDLTCLILSLWR
jgi:hypothetical protein